MSNGLSSIIGAIPVRPSASGPPPAPELYQLAMEELDSEIPAEYHGAEINAGLMADLKERPGSIYLHGAPGTGKTRQAWAMVRTDRRARMRKELEGVEVDHIPVHGEWWPRTIYSAWAEEARKRMLDGGVRVITESADIRRYRYDRDWLDGVAKHPGWLAVDDIGFIDPSEWVVEAIYHLANERRAHKRQTLWTSNLTPDQLGEKFGAAISSRLAGGRVLELSGDDRRLA